VRRRDRETEEFLERKRARRHPTPKQIVLVRAARTRRRLHHRAWRHDGGILAPFAQICHGIARLG
jgi:hypothetical protein